MYLLGNIISALHKVVEFLDFSRWYIGIVVCIIIIVLFFASLDIKFNLDGRGSGLWGSKYKKKLIIVLDAGSKPEEIHEVKETEIFLLLHPELLEQLDAAEIPELLDRLKGIVNNKLKITLVEIHQSSMGSLKTWFNAFHAFIVFKTTSEIDNGVYWWSLEKNLECIVLQRSRNKDDVKDKLYGKERKQVKPDAENLAGKGSIKDLFGMFLTHEVIQELYNLGLSNCQSLVSLVSKQITEIGYEYDGLEVIPPRQRPHFAWLCNRNVIQRQKNLQGIQTLTGVSEWPPLFHLIYFENGTTDLIDKVIKSGNYDINAVHGGITPLHFAVMLKKTEMVKHLLKDPINADPTTRDSKKGRNALHWAVLNTWEAEIFDLLLAHPKVKVDDVDVYGQTALHLAARVSNVKAAQKLLEKGANPNIFNKKGWSPLHVAALQGETEIIDLILQAQKHNHVDDDKTANGRTALHCAAALSNEITAEHLINKGADLHSRDNDGLTPLHMAALHAKDMNIIDILLKHIKDEDMPKYKNDVKLVSLAYKNQHLLGTEIVARLERINNRKEKPQSWAYKIRNVPRHAIKYFGKFFIKDIKEVANVFKMNRIRKPKTWADRILAKCANYFIYVYKFIFKPSTFLYSNLSRLRIAKAKNSQEIDEILKEEKFDINSREQNGQTPLLDAIGANNVNAVRRLLEKGADSTKRNYNGLTPFQVAATQEKNLDILDLLQATGKVKIDDGGQFGYTLLHWAVATSNVNAVRFLLSKRAYPNVADENEATPLHVAAYCANTIDVIKLILETKQVDINRRDKNGQTALHYAVRRNRVKNVRYLLENGADRTIRDENGDTPIHLAAAAVSQDSANYAGMTALHMALKKSYFKAALFLLSKGANLNIADENGVTPLQLLKKVLKYFRQLQKKGAMKVMENQKFKLRRADCRV
jgi:ankyrin repeat protein